jgi:hypothetical protein
MMTEEERYDTDRDDLCNCLRWKSLFVGGEPDPTVQSGRSFQFWCLYTQTVIGPDGNLVEPMACLAGRACFGTGRAG